MHKLKTILHGKYSLRNKKYNVCLEKGSEYLGSSFYELYNIPLYTNSWSEVYWTLFEHTLYIDCIHT